MSKPEFVYVIHIEAPRARVWEALTTGEQTVLFWTRYVQSQWSVGARVEFLREDRKTLSHDGVVLEIDPPRRLVMTFDVSPEGFAEPASRVTYELKEAKAGTQLKVIHEGFPPGSKVLLSISEGWPAILSSMKTYLETGRPMGAACSA
ncbi:MAG: SRPBCC family protein [Hyphomonadaceae bacterium]|nr:SRPBCC family protein [Hyphomonadaceae bacterium]MBX3510224.1 SRPBCC family protein [Hyphomonadaceae bacterium]